MSPEDNAAWKIRCMEAEAAVEAASKAFDLIPIWALERGQQWIPSEAAIHLLKRAKDSVRAFEADHWHGTKESDS